jgi:hypothetical protein
MKEFDGFLYDKYIFYYYNTLVLNYAKEDKDKALEILQLAKDNKTIKKLPAYTSFIYLNTTLIYYQKSNYALAATNISRLIQQEDFLSLDKAFQLKLHIVELIIRWELGQEERILGQIDFINSEYKKILIEDHMKRDAEVIELISLKANKASISDKIAVISSAMSDEESRDSDIISYNDWLKTLKQK